MLVAIYANLLYFIRMIENERIYEDILPLLIFFVVIHITISYC